MTRKRGLIQTVGKTERPIIKSLETYHPEVAVFIVSEASLPYAEKALAAAPPRKYKILQLDDPEDMTEMYVKGRHAYRLLREEGVEEFYADPTGGTKVMAAGLVLALAGLKFTFIYVGGQKRDDAGRVITGYEEVRTMVDPTERFHVFEQRAFMQAWDAWRMQSAAQSLREILQDRDEMGENERRYFEALLDVTEGMYEWDRFHHAAAEKYLEKALPAALAVAEKWGHQEKIRVLSTLQDELEFLKRVRADTQAGRPTFAVLKDLLANAKRRADAGRYDDALARLYRAVELLLDAHFFEKHKLHLEHPKSWPEQLQRRKDLVRRANKISGLYSKLDLAFDLSLALGETATLPQLLFGKKDKLSKLLRERHKSILAHGVQPVEEKDFTALWNFLTELGLKPAKPWPRWREP